MPDRNNLWETESVLAQFPGIQFITVGKVQQSSRQWEHVAGDIVLSNSIVMAFTGLTRAHYFSTMEPKPRGCSSVSVSHLYIATFLPKRNLALVPPCLPPVPHTGRPGEYLLSLTSKPCDNHEPCE